MYIKVYDIECLGGMFLYMEYDPQTDTWAEFEISEYRNDLFALTKWLTKQNAEDYLEVYGISYNGIFYDAQILQYIIDNHQRWINLSNTQIIRKIKKFSDKVIEDGNYELFPPYREEQFENQQIDLMRIHHFDNEARRCSLKWLQFSMDFYNVEDMPYHHTKRDFTEEQIKEIRDYCRNDVESTFELWKYTLGQTLHEEYNGKNKVQDRLDLIEELGFPKKALSWSDVKLGDEINKKTYLEITGLDAGKLYELKKNRKTTAGFTYGDCIPNYVKFKTKPFQDFLARMKKVRVNLNEKEEYPFVYNGTHYMIAKGGIHSNEKNRIVEPRESEICMDADVGSQYPHSLIKRGLFPSHLGKAWLAGYTRTRNKRLTYKQLSKDQGLSSQERKKYKGLSETFKLALNGGGFGKTNERNSWQYDPFVHFSCTIGNQFEILMLIEELEINGIHVISANTDGIVCLFNRSQLDKYYEICHEWENKVGNSEQGRLEFTEYKKIVQLSVNGYLAIKVDGEVKKKKEFLTEHELHKNKSRRVIALALEKYFVDGIPVEETIKNHRNIFNFCIGVRGNKDYHYENKGKDGSVEIHDKMLRYYVSKDGKKLFRIKNEGSEADGPDISQAEAGKWRCTTANKIDKDVPIEKYNIDYSYYIEIAEERIRALETGRKGGSTDKNQTSLF